MKSNVLIGQTDYSVFVYIPDPASTDGSGKTGLVAANLTVSYARMETDNDATVTDVTSSLNNLASLTAAHNDWGLLEVSSTLAPGLYRLDIGDAVFATGAWSAVVYVMITSSAAAASPMEFVLTALDPFTNAVNVTQIGGSAVTAASGIPEVKVASIANNAITAASINADAITDAKVASDVTIASVTGAVGSVTGNVGGNVTGSVGSVASGGITAASIAADAIGASELAADAATEIATAVWASATRTLSALGFTLGASDLASDTITAAKIAADSIGASELAADAATEIAVAVWAAATRTLSALGFTLGASDLAADTITAAKLAADVTTELQAGLATQASVDTIDDFLDTEIADIRNRLPAALVSGRMDASVGAMAADVVTASAIATDAIGANELAASAVSEIQSGLSTLDAAGVRSAVGLASANLDTQLDALPTNAELATALAAADDAVLAQVALIKAKTDNLPADPADESNILAAIAALTDLSAAEIGDAVLDEVVEGTWTLRQMMRLSMAALVGLVSGAEGNAPVFRDIDDTKDRITAVTDSNGNRTSITLDGS